MFQIYFKENKQNLSKITSIYHVFTYAMVLDFCLNPNVHLYEHISELVSNSHTNIMENHPMLRFLCPVWVARAFFNGKMPLYMIFVYVAVMFLFWQLMEFLKTKFNLFKILVCMSFNKTSKLISNSVLSFICTFSKLADNNKSVLNYHNNFNL